MVDCIIGQHHEECIDCISKVAEPEVKDDGCGAGYCQCNGGCHTCASCISFNTNVLKGITKDDGCGEGFCDCNGCHTCQSCYAKDLVTKPGVKDDGCGAGYCQCNGGCHTCASC